MMVAVGRFVIVAVVAVTRNSILLLICLACLRFADINIPFVVEQLPLNKTQPNLLILNSCR